MHVSITLTIDINKAYRALMIANHPDKGGSRYVAEKEQIVNILWVVPFLMDKMYT